MLNRDERDKRRAALRKTHTIVVYVSKNDKLRLEAVALESGRRSASEFLRELSLVEVERVEKQDGRRDSTK